MKTETLVFVGIAVCAILLTSPALASAGYSKIYGNANEDDVLDMRDVTYIKLVIFGKKPATTFADANYDGKISMLDVGQAKLIILGKEKKLTLIDQADRTVTVPRPIERVVCRCRDGERAVIQLGAEDKLVGVCTDVSSPDVVYLPLKAYPKFKELPNVGGCWGVANIELIVSLNPDVVFAWGGHIDEANTIQENTGIPVVGLSSMQFDVELYKLVGKVIEKEKESEELISYIHGKIAEVTEVTSQISESVKPKVFLYFWSCERTPTRYDPVDIAGGINVAKDLAPITGYGAVDVSKEQIIAWNPDIILIHSSSKKHKISTEGVLADHALQTVNAVKNKRVYYTKGYRGGWDKATGLTEVYHMAKLFHPDKFEDLDVEVEGNEILKRFYGADGLYTYISEQLDLQVGIE